jgi:acetoin utilization deacetylase AcuC-like enzyme
VVNLVEGSSSETDLITLAIKWSAGQTVWRFKSIIQAQVLEVLRHFEPELLLVDHES